MSQPPLRTGLAAFTASGAALGSFLAVVQTIKQLWHFRSRLYAWARIHEPIDWHNQLAHSRVATSCASTPKARGLRHGEYSPCIRLSRTPTTTPHPPLPQGIGVSSRVSPVLLSTLLRIPEKASRVQCVRLKWNDGGGVFLAAPSALCGSPVGTQGRSG